MKRSDQIRGLHLCGDPRGARAEVFEHPNRRRSGQRNDAQGALGSCARGYDAGRDREARAARLRRTCARLCHLAGGEQMIQVVKSAMDDSSELLTVVTWPSIGRQHFRDWGPSCPSECPIQTSRTGARLTRLSVADQRFRPEPAPATRRRPIATGVLALEYSLALPEIQAAVT